jgi:hypothetical protein
MSIGTLTLTPGGCIACGYYLRGVGGVLVGGGNPANMVDWINAYDMDTLAWNSLQTGNFTAPSQTTPPTQSSGGISGAITGSQNQLRTLTSTQAPPCTITDDNPPVAYRAQALLPFPTAYYIIAWGLPMDAALSASCGDPAFWVAQGCIYPQQADDKYPMIVELQIPDDTIDSSILVQNYYLGIIQPGSGYNSMNGPLFAMQQDLAGATAASLNMNGLGPNWNPSAVCDASPDDPFTGLDP